MPDFVQRRTQIESSENMVTVGSALVGELSEEAVTAGNIAGDPMVVDFSVGRTRDRHGMVGGHGKRVSFDLGRLTALPLNRLYFGRSYAINLEAEPGVRGFVERDPCGPHTQNFGNQRREIGDVPAIGAGENPLQGGLLLVVAAIVKIERHFPPTVLHVAGRICDQRRVQTIENGVAMMALVDMPSDHDFAFTLRWW